MATTIGTYTSDVSNATTSNGCLTTNKQFYPSIFGPDLAIPQWEAIFTAIILSLIILLTIIGNILVILSVFTYKPLRIVQNFFIVSLAVADLTVAILVLPLNVAYSILGKWNFGISLCKMWLTCDILCCTSSILNLCAIALDRYWAITDPINYAQKRTVERVLLLITGVWVLSLVISSPPLIGWNDWPDVEMDDYPCQLTKQQGYVIYSSLGSFYIPLLIMSIVYLEIFLATKRRLRERANASRMNALNLKGHIETVTVQPDADPESVSDETNHNEHPNVSDTAAHKRTMDKLHRKDKRQKIKDSLKKEREKQLNKTNDNLDTMICENENSVTDNNAENSSESNKLNENGTSLILTDATVLNDKSKLTNKKSPLMPTKQSIKKPSVYQFIEEKQKISLSKERRAARTLGIIMGVFVVCWLPFFLMYVIIPFCSSCCPTDKFINFITWLGYINSALNPIIYTIFNLDYRRAFKKLLGIKN